jgi:hypothetical protein
MLLLVFGILMLFVMITTLVPQIVAILPMVVNTFKSHVMILILVQRIHVTLTLVVNISL